jgi:muconolactone D-isomerase
VEFLVEITVHWPPSGDPVVKESLVAAETARSEELVAAGLLKRLWRKPGSWANIGLWEAADATELHEALSSLPFFPWLEIDVRPLARHHSDPLARKDGDT